VSGQDHLRPLVGRDAPLQHLHEAALQLRMQMRLRLLDDEGRELVVGGLQLQQLGGHEENVVEAQSSSHPGVPRH
jgi:hypothetical protein